MQREFSVCDLEKKKSAKLKVSRFCISALERFSTVAIVVGG